MQKHLKQISTLPKSEVKKLSRNSGRVKFYFQQNHVDSFQIQGFIIRIFTARQLH